MKTPFKVVKICLAIALAFGVGYGCHGGRVPLSIPEFSVEQVGPNLYLTKADSLEHLLAGLKCGDAGVCVVQTNGEIYTVILDEHTVLVQIPLRNANEVAEELTKKGYLTLIDPSTGRVFVQKRKTSNEVPQSFQWQPRTEEPHPNSQHDGSLADAQR